MNESRTCIGSDTRLTQPGLRSVPDDDLLHEVIAKIADMADAYPEDANIQWAQGYAQACGDIVLMVCRMAQKRRASLIKG